VLQLSCIKTAPESSSDAPPPTLKAVTIFEIVSSWRQVTVCAIGRNFWDDKVLWTANILKLSTDSRIVTEQVIEG
jgi:hypothetical protein